MAPVRNQRNAGTREGSASVRQHPAATEELRPRRPLSLNPDGFSFTCFCYHRKRLLSPRNRCLHDKNFRRKRWEIKAELSMGGFYREIKHLVRIPCRQLAKGNQEDRKQAVMMPCPVPGWTVKALSPVPSGDGNFRLAGDSDLAESAARRLETEPLPDRF